MRAYKTVNDAYIEPISFTVPRRAETFQADIFPPATGTKPAVSAQEWLAGKTGIPHKLDLESIYDGSEPKEIASDYQAPTASTTASAPAPKPAPKEEPKREEPKPAPVVRSPPPTMSEQKGSIAAMASKYQDNEESEESEDESSSFEEITRPAQRTHVPIRSEPKPSAPTKTQSAPAPAPVAAPVKPASPPVSTTPTPRASTASTSITSSPDGVQATLDQIRQLIENQTTIIAAQNKQISLLTSEVEGLKRKVGSGSSQDQSERIRQLELELEEARS